MWSAALLGALLPQLLGLLLALQCARKARRAGPGRAPTKNLRPAVDSSCDTNGLGANVCVKPVR